MYVPMWVVIWVQVYLWVELLDRLLPAIVPGWLDLPLSPTRFLISTLLSTLGLGTFVQYLADSISLASPVPS